MKTILFQGDSITDAGRDYHNDGNLGFGYPGMTAGKLGVDYPGTCTFINRGISGNRIVDLYARIKCDFINLKPDIISILIGVNDVWHEMDFNNGVEAEKFERIYDMLISELKEALPETKIIILEPFVLPGTGTNRYFDVFDSEVRKRAAAAKRVSEKHGLLFVPLQEKLEALAAASHPEDVLSDGVHPSFAGHELISRELYRIYSTLL